MEKLDITKIQDRARRGGGGGLGGANEEYEVMLFVNLAMLLFPSIPRICL